MAETKKTTVTKTVQMAQRVLNQTFQPQTFEDGTLLGAAGTDCEERRDVVISADDDRRLIKSKKVLAFGVVEQVIEEEVEVSVEESTDESSDQPSAPVSSSLVAPTDHTELPGPITFEEVSKQISGTPAPPEVLDTTDRKPKRK